MFVIKRLNRQDWRIKFLLNMIKKVVVGVHPNVHPSHGLITVLGTPIHSELHHFLNIYSDFIQFQHIINPIIALPVVLSAIISLWV